MYIYNGCLIWKFGIIGFELRVICVVPKRGRRYLTTIMSCKLFSRWYDNFLFGCITRRRFSGGRFMGLILIYIKDSFPAAIRRHVFYITRSLKEMQVQNRGRMLQVYCYFWVITLSLFDVFSEDFGCLHTLNHVIMLAFGFAFNGGFDRGSSTFWSTWPLMYTCRC